MLVIYRSASPQAHPTPWGFRPAVLPVLFLLLSPPAYAKQDAAAPAAPAAASSPEQPAAPVRVTCESKPGTRTECSADTSAGVVLVRSTGEAPCLLGRTWGYDQKTVW